MRNVFQRRGIHGGSMPLQQWANAASMIGMLVCDQDAFQDTARMLVQPGLHRGCAARIHHRTALAFCIVQQPDIVVGKGGQGVNSEHDGGIL